MARTLHDEPLAEEVPRPRRRGGTRRVELIRRSLLGFLVLAVLSIGALLLFGRAGRTGDEDATASAVASDRDLAEDVVIAGEGFDFTVTAGQQTRFAVRAERTLSVASREDEMNTVRMTGTSTSPEWPSGKAS